jgi:hypothetical protein
MAAPEAVLRHLSLLFHAVRAKWLTGRQAIVIGAGAETKPPVKQIPQLGGNAPAKVDHGPPRLILSTVSQLMSQYSQVALAAAGKKDVVAERNGTIAAGFEHQPAQTSSHSGASTLVEPHARAIHLEG